MMNEDYTVAALLGIPIFCLDRVYSVVYGTGDHLKSHHKFKFLNGYGARAAILAQ